jgi:hypothetical protein
MAENWWAGILQIDIITPLDTGTAEAENKYSWISRLFHREAIFGDVIVKKTYRAMSGAEPDKPYYRTAVRVEWRASLPRD